jgi:hypothetical protein
LLLYVREIEVAGRVCCATTSSLPMAESTGPNNEDSKYLVERRYNDGAPAYAK